MALIPEVGKTKVKIRLLLVLIAFFLWTGVLLHLFPVWWMFTTSIKPMREIFVFPPRFWPEEPSLMVYKLIFRVIRGNPVFRYPIYVYLKNSAVLTGVTMLFQIPIVAMLAYSVSKLLSARSTRPIFLYCIGPMMIPGTVALIASYLFLSHFPFPTITVPRIPFTNRSFPFINFIGSYWSVILPGVYNAFFFLLFKGFFDTIPDELINAARLDGAGELKIFRRIVLPLSKPVFAVVAYFSFNVSWNNFMWPLIVLQKNRLYPLSVIMYKLQDWLTNTRPENPNPSQLELLQMGMGYNGLMAMAIIESIPVFVMFIIFREYLMTGIKLRGFK